MQISRERDGNVIDLFPDEQSERPQRGETWPGKRQGIPKLYSGCTLENYEGNEKLVKDLQEIHSDGIILRGPTGCGKTHLAIAMIRADARAYFITVPDLLLKIRGSFSGGEHSEEEIVRRYSELPALVLDDLGSEKASEFSIAALYLILDRRIRDCRRTIITTNLSQDDIEKIFGARISSRLAGMENIKINMPDYRKKRGKKLLINAEKAAENS